MNHLSNQSTFTKSIIRIFVVTALVLSVPLLAMRFSSDVRWSLFDFLVIGALLIGTGIIFETVSRRLKNPTQRAIAFLALVVAFFLTWAELAVGIFDSPFAGS